MNSTVDCINQLLLTLYYVHLKCACTGTVFLVPSRHLIVYTVGAVMVIDGSLID